ncbi:protein translocase subunit SecD [Psychrobium sp. 1_MG-2023]|uniref:protein translocase subunit SecD n=1 Tax=Psychrobium sp. 1_MG-2023 TaxID=3062624 RepID=UPI000C3256C8|nr:protein translocase subunit SecD [Psychrobium sp. 1_MG-2023]MDP2559807.1 protein translocase subunit SecD [Psychrobium sp. 1_MG-2023]PKF59087.1 protein translocase subunit SecD [Alteromonadales bacterium alter-6D02]
MLNRYPLWKTLLVALTVLIGFLFAAPNLYEPDHALQISGVRGSEVQVSTFEQVKSKLEQQLEIKSAVLEDGQILVRLNDLESQLKARELTTELLGDKFSVALNMAQTTPGWLAAMGASPLSLGLDLRGGIYFLMEVDMKDLLKTSREQMVLDYKTDLRKERIRYQSIRLQSEGVLLKFRDEEKLEQALTLLKGRYATTNFVQLKSAPLSIRATMSPELLREIKLAAVEQNITIIRSRVNELGVAEPDVQRQGEDRIVVQLPGIQDTARAKELLGATATLEFHMVNEQASPGSVPAGSKVYQRREGGSVVLYKKVMLRGTHITDASSGFSENAQPEVNIKLDAKGGNKISEASKRNINKPMATVFIEYKPTGKVDKDGKQILRKVEEVISVATITTQLGRSFRITGLDSPAEARSLSLLLRAGALRAPIQIVEERTVGPSLGKENIELGATAIVLGLAGVLLFMLVYYRGFGVVSNIALAANVVLIIGVMSMIPGASLTLPGMAGIVLTVGMAVDANVLIFERIREELAAGRTPQQAIHHGYDAAISTIFDANITTLIAAIILFSFGAGPIKGFAITLSIGIITSVFTAVVVTRTVVNLWVGGKRVDKLSI